MYTYLYIYYIYICVCTCMCDPAVQLLKGHPQPIIQISWKGVRTKVWDIWATHISQNSLIAIPFCHFQCPHCVWPLLVYFFLYNPLIIEIAILSILYYIGVKGQQKTWSINQNLCKSIWVPSVLSWIRNLAHCFDCCYPLVSIYVPIRVPQKITIILGSSPC
jgi:hypothetical protein